MTKGRMIGFNDVLPYHGGIPSEQFRVMAIIREIALLNSSYSKFVKLWADITPIEVYYAFQLTKSEALGSNPSLNDPKNLESLCAQTLEKVLDSLTEDSFKATVRENVSHIPIEEPPNLSDEFCDCEIGSLSIMKKIKLEPEPEFPTFEQPPSEAINHSLKRIKGRRGKWPLEEQILFNDLASNGKTAHEISQLLNRTLASCLGYYEKWASHKHSPLQMESPWSSEEQNRLQEMIVIQKMDWEEVSAAFGRDINFLKEKYAAVHRKQRRKHEATSTKQSWSPEMEQQLMTMRKNKNRWSTISTTLRVPIDQCKAKLAQLKECGRYNKHKDWTKEELATFLDLVQSRQSWGEIVSKLPWRKMADWQTELASMVTSGVCTEHGVLFSSDALQKYIESKYSHSSKEESPVVIHRHSQVGPNIDIELLEGRGYFTL